MFYVLLLEVYFTLVANREIKRKPEFKGRSIPGLYQKRFLFPWGALNDQPRERPQHGCQVSVYPQVIDHLGRN